MKSVAVVGRDAEGWLAALALRRALGRIGVSITMVELPSLLTPVDAYAAVPSLGGLHRLLGIAEAEVLQASAGVPVLGQRFVDWQGAGSAFIHGYDSQRPAIDDVDLLQYWVEAQARGLKLPFDEFSPAAAAARQGRVARSGSDPDSLTSLFPGYHLDARGYVALIRRRALKSGVRHVQGVLTGIERDGMRIDAVRVEGGARLSADLFVDASGEEAALIGTMPGAELERWRRWLPADRVLSASGPPLKQLPSFAQITAFQSGWIALHPLRDRTAIMGAWDSAALPDGEIPRAIAAVTGMRPAGDAVVAPFEAGMLAQPWIGNCIAIGSSAIRLEPLDAIQLHLTHLGLSNLIALFPTRSDAMPEAAAYNRAIRSHATNLRDFQIAHYALSRRSEPFWVRAREVAPSESLTAKISLFAARGLIAMRDDEAFQEQNWSATFLGHGLVPSSWDPLVEKLTESEKAERFQAFLRHIAGEVRAMPTVAEYLGGAPAT